MRAGRATARAGKVFLLVAVSALALAASAEARWHGAAFTSKRPAATLAQVSSLFSRVNALNNMSCQFKQRVSKRPSAWAGIYCTAKDNRGAGVTFTLTPAADCSSFTVVMAYNAGGSETDRGTKWAIFPLLSCRRV